VLELISLRFLMYFGCACIGDLHYWFP